MEATKNKVNVTFFLSDEGRIQAIIKEEKIKDLLDCIYSVSQIVGIDKAPYTFVDITQFVDEEDKDNIVLVNLKNITAISIGKEICKNKKLYS